MPAQNSGPRKVDYHGDPQKDSKTCKSLHDRGLLENQNTTLQLLEVTDTQKGNSGRSSVV